MRNVFDACREMICSALHGGQRSATEQQSWSWWRFGRMLDQQPNLYVNLSKSCQAYNVNIQLLVCGHADGRSGLGFLSCLNARLAAQRKMISRLHKYCLSAIDGRKCTNSVFWGGVRGRG